MEIDKARKLAELVNDRNTYKTIDSFLDSDNVNSIIFDVNGSKRTIPRNHVRLLKEVIRALKIIINKTCKKVVRTNYIL